MCLFAQGDASQAEEDSEDIARDYRNEEGNFDPSNPDTNDRDDAHNKFIKEYAAARRLVHQRSAKKERLAAMCS